ncbi:hypothetical protein RZE82_06990 [Mollicutes bacterium LVI A0039]|nr:hypothetical protein RZE82_06990 [Mollicutes bacterium LVI A0039]
MFYIYVIVILLLCLIFGGWYYVTDEKDDFESLKEKRIYQEEKAQTECMIIIGFIFLVIVVIFSIKLYLSIDSEKDTIIETQELYNQNNDFTNLEISLHNTDNFILANVVVSSQSKTFNEEELRYSLGEYQKNKTEDSKLNFVNYTYYQEQSGFDEFGQSIPDKECTLEFSTNTFNKINFENISVENLIKISLSDNENDNCFKTEEE